jgi:hypothetical protein
MKVRREWMKPPEGKLKVNVDASFAAGMGSTGVVIRDSGGGFIAASVSFFAVTAGCYNGRSLCFEGRFVLGEPNWL